jgi:diguanylate cyclase (GGDEF)-like protein
MKRMLFLLGGAAAIAASYLAVIFGLSPAESFGSSTIASIALPALVSGFVVVAFIAMEAKGARDMAGKVHQLQAQLAHKEVELTRMATHDDLTGLCSRLHFDETLSLEFERARRHSRPFAIVLAEIDGLEEFTERTGSLSRSYVLAEVAALLRATLRINDTGCRYTDSCLAVLLPETDLPGAQVVAERVRMELARREFFGRGQATGSKLTVSQGIAVFPSAGLASHQDLHKAARVALIEAKSAGRGNIRCYAPAPGVAADADPTRQALAS